MFLKKSYLFFSINFNKQYNIIYDSQIPFTNVVNNIDEYTTILKESILKIYNINLMFNDFERELLDKVYDNQKQFDKYGIIIYKAIHYVFMFFGALGIISAVFYGLCCKCKCFRIFFLV